MFQVFFNAMPGRRVKRPVTDELSRINTSGKYINISYANSVLLEPPELYRCLINSRRHFSQAQYWHH